MYTNLQCLVYYDASILNYDHVNELYIMLQFGIIYSLYDVFLHDETLISWIHSIAIMDVDQEWYICTFTNSIARDSDEMF